MSNEQDLEYSENPICYDVANDSERPHHDNWVIPAGTTMLVDYDHVIRRRIADYLHQEDLAFRKRFGIPPEETS